MKCPECQVGELEFNPQLRKYTCNACGIALTKSEAEDMWDDIRFQEDTDDRREKQRQEYKDWYFKRKKK